MCGRNTVRESSHISFFCGRRPFCEILRRPENTHQRVSAFSQKLQTLYCLFKSHADIWISSSPTYFSVYGWLSKLTYFRFFPVICWSHLRTEISVTLFLGNKLYSRHHILYFTFLWKPLCWCYLATALNLLSSSLPAKLVYYIISIGIKCT